MGDSQVNYVYIATKRAILKGKTITIYDEQGNKIDRTITFNDDNSVATYTYKGKTTEFKRGGFIIKSPLLYFKYLFFIN